MINRDELVPIGHFKKPHGIKGEITFLFINDSFTTSECPFLICEMDGIFVPFRIEKYRFISGSMAFIKLKNMDSDQKVRILSHKEVFFPKKHTKENFENDSFTWDNFIGFTLTDERLGKIGRIVESVVKASKKPVTVKIRKGFEGPYPNAVEVAKTAENAGAAAICVHGRFRSQFYSGKADWDIIKAVKEAVKIPVIGNGDIVDLATYQAIQKHTRCDGVMIGRGAQGNPWVFKEITGFIQNGVIPPPPALEERLEVALFHTAEISKAKGEYIGIREMRKHLGWYVKGLPGASELRKEIIKLKTYDEVEKMFESYREYLAKQ